MKQRLASFLAMLAIGSVAAFAGPGPYRFPGLTADEILAAAPGIEDKTPAELTVGERLAIASALSLSMQKAMYVRHAATASFLFPGAGQAMTGSAGGALLHAGAELAIHGAALAGLWYLSPEPLKDFSLTREERKAAMALYFTQERIGELLPAMGVAFGGAFLSTLNRLVAAGSAAAAAKANIEAGKVTFEPIVGMGGMGFGFRMGLR